MKRSELKEAIKAEIKSVLSEEEEKFQMTYKGDPVDLKISKFGGNAEGARDTVLFVNVGGIGKRRSKASKNALEKRKELLNQKVDKIMFTNKDNISKEIKDISKSDFKIQSVLSEDFNDDNRGLAYIKSDGERDGFESFTQYAGKQDLKNVPDLEAYTDGFAKGVMQKGNKLVQLISRATVGGADAEPLMKMIGLKEVYQTNSKMSQMVSLFQDMMADEYDGMLIPKAFKDFMPKFFEAINKDYESAERFGEKISNIREDEDEDNKAAEKDAKKEKKFAGKQKEAEDLKTKIEDKKAEMVKKAKEYKAAEGEKKEKIKDQLKKMTAERDELNKQLEKLKKVKI